MGEKKTLCTRRKSENRRLVQPKVSKLILSITKNNPVSHSDQRCDRPVTCQPRVNSQFIGLSAAVSLWAQRVAAFVPLSQNGLFIKLGV